jgi:hypothetical protein
VRAKRARASFCADLDLRSSCSRLIFFPSFFAVYSEGRLGGVRVYAARFVWLTTPLVGWTHVISERNGLDCFYRIGLHLYRNYTAGLEMDWTAFTESASISTEITRLVFM